MRIDELPEKTQDYLKVIWEAYERTGELVALGAIAERMGEKKSTASEAIKKLSAQKLIRHEPYHGVKLTKQGEAIALTMVRRHRLIETFLVSKLGYTWDEVHEEAEKLEHAVTDRFITSIDRLLGHPDRDPHGDPIPTAAGKLPPSAREDLSSLKPGTSGIVDRINDSDSELLRYLADAGIRPGVTLTAEGEVYNGARRYRVADTEAAVVLAESMLWAIRINPA